MIIRLSNEDMARAAKVGALRQSESIHMGLKDKHGAYGDGLKLHALGAAGELCVAKAIGVEWMETVNTFKRGGDVLDLQVRTRSMMDYDLIHRDDDNPDAKFVHVVRLSENTFDVIGWILGRDARQPQWRKMHGNREAAWFVPNNALRPVEELVAKKHHNPFLDIVSAALLGCIMLGTLGIVTITAGFRPR